MNAFFCTAAVIIIQFINKMKILGIGKIWWQFNLAVYAMSVAYVENCFYSINILVFVTGVGNQLVVISILFCKNFIPGNEVGVAVAKNNYNGVAVVSC